MNITSETYGSTSETYVAPFLQPEITPQASVQPSYSKSSSKPLVDSYGSPVKYPESVLDYKNRVPSPPSIDSYSAPKPESGPKYSNPSPVAADSYSAPKPPTSYSPPTTAASIDSYGVPKYSPLDSIDTYGPPKAEPVSSQYFPPASGDSLDSYGPPKSEPESSPASGQYSPPVQNVDSYGSPQAEPVQPYNPPPKPGYSTPTTTPCPPKDHPPSRAQCYKTFYIRNLLMFVKKLECLPLISLSSLV